MTIEEYAKYVMQNIGRATRGNAIRIVDKLGDDNEYPFLDFVACIENYVNEQLSSSQPDSNRGFYVLVAVRRAKIRYTSNNTPNKRMVIDNFILDLWDAINGTEE